jgi:hypothetical protein
MEDLFGALISFLLVPPLSINTNLQLEHFQSTELEYSL